MFLIIFYFGAILGSFLSVLAYRLPIHKPVTLDRSRCQSCQHTLPIQALFPIFSYLAYQGTCQYCRSPIPIYHFFMEILTGSVTVYAVYYAPHTPDYLIFYLLLLMSLTLSLTDILYWLVEPKLLYLFTTITLLVSLYYIGFQWLNLISPLIVLFFFSILDTILTNSIGGGDIKLLLVYAYFLSPIHLTFLIFSASFLGILFIIISPLFTHKKVSKIPFVPFLTVGFFLTLYLL